MANNDDDDCENDDDAADDSSEVNPTDGKNTVVVLVVAEEDVDGTCSSFLSVNDTIMVDGGFIVRVISILWDEIETSRVTHGKMMYTVSRKSNPQLMNMNGYKHLYCKHTHKHTHTHKRLLLSITFRLFSLLSNRSRSMSSMTNNFTRRSKSDQYDDDCQSKNAVIITMVTLSFSQHHHHHQQQKQQQQQRH
jgi:hypothetical protein